MGVPEEYIEDDRLNLELGGTRCYLPTHPGTDLAHGGICLRACYVTSGTDYRVVSLGGSRPLRGRAYTSTPLNCPGSTLPGVLRTR
eukprot:629143-Rhodomonas_salina.2